jgi:hypothetical protein
MGSNTLRSRCPGMFANVRCHSHSYTGLYVVGGSNSLHTAFSFWSTELKSSTLVLPESSGGFARYV